MRHNHQQNEKILKEDKKQIDELLEELVVNTIEELVDETFKQYEEILSTVSLSNESTKETVVFKIPIYNEITCEKKGREYSARCNIYTDSDIGYKILTAAWHGTGISISQDVMQYVENVTGKTFGDQFPETADEEGNVDPNKLSPFYFNPTYADTKFKDAVVLNASDYPIEVQFLEGKQ